MRTKRIIAKCEQHSGYGAGAVTQNIMNTNVLVEKEQSLKNMTIFQALEIIAYIFTVTYAVGSTLSILLLE